MKTKRRVPPVGGKILKRKAGEYVATITIRQGCRDDEKLTGGAAT
jgi:hypothetical protein